MGTRRKLVWSVVVGAAVLALAVAYAGRSSTASVPAPAPSAPPPAVTFAARATAPSRAAVRASASPSAAAPAMTTASAAPPVPPGVTPAQWQALRAEMAGRPDGAAELQRLSDYFAYQDTLQRFRALRTSQPDAPALQPLALQLQQGLPDRLRRNELSVDEAQLVELAALQVLQPDDAARQQALQQWRASLPAQSVAPAVAARDAQFQHDQAALVAAWQALPAARRDPALLKQQLQALRERSYPAPGS
jgi:hypothetical protein